MITALDLQFLLLIFLSILVTYNHSSMADQTLRSQKIINLKMNDFESEVEPDDSNHEEKKQSEIDRLKQVE
jgi:hypothetical protein